MDLVSITLHVYDLRPVGSTLEDTQAQDVELDLTDKSTDEALQKAFDSVVGLEKTDRIELKLGTSSYTSLKDVRKRLKGMQGSREVRVLVLGAGSTPTSGGSYSERHG